MSDTKKLRVGAHERKIKRLEKQLQEKGDRHTTLKEQFLVYKRNTEEVVTSEVAARRRLTDTVADNNMKLTEYEQQIAVQYKENAELRQDMRTLQDHYANAVEIAKTADKQSLRWQGELTSALLMLEDYRRRPSPLRRIKDILGIA